MVAIERDHQRLAREELRVEPRVGLGAAHEPDVQIAAHEGRDLLARRQLPQVDAHTGMALPVGTHHLAQRREHQRRPEAHAQHPDLAGLRLSGRVN
jgi:hypothetical protein